MSSNQSPTVWIGLAAFFAGTTLASAVFIAIQLHARDRQPAPAEPDRYVMIVPPEFSGGQSSPDRTRWTPGYELPDQGRMRAGYSETEIFIR